MCRHDKCRGICAWWAIKPDTSAEHIQQDVLFCPCVCLKIPSLGPTWAPPVRRRRTLGRVLGLACNDKVKLLELCMLGTLTCGVQVSCTDACYENCMMNIGYGNSYLALSLSFGHIFWVRGGEKCDSAVRLSQCIRAFAVLGISASKSLWVCV